MRITSFRTFALILGAVSVAGVAAAEVRLRVDAKPLSRPIDAYVLATDDGGAMPGLAAEDFAVRLDGMPIGQFKLTLPPRQNPTQRLSVVIVTSHFIRQIGPVRHAGAYAALIKRLVPGDFAAVVLLGYGVNNDGQRYYPISVLPFREIDGGGNTDLIVDFLESGQSSLAQEFDGDFLNRMRGVKHALAQFEHHDALLPEGPRAIVTWEIPTYDLSEIVIGANQNDVSIFSRHFVGRRTYPDYFAAQEVLAENTGGIVVKILPDSDSATHAIESWLKDGYRLTIPAAAADDCNLHMLEVTVRGQLTSAPFVRCDSIPERIAFPPQDGVAGGSMVTSEKRRVRGIRSPTHISVHDGEYSIGCSRTFTSAPGYVQPGQVICVRHNAATRPGAGTTTRLIIGGVSSFFESYAAL